MSDWTAKRFWTTTETVAQDGGFGIALDGRPVKTPAKVALIAPTQRMANAIAAEWDAQEGAIDPGTMPVTRGANAAIDKVGPQFEEVVDLLAAYGESDLLCYRAAGPDALVASQAEHWDPLLDWAANTYGTRLFVGEGVMHVPQTAAGQARFRDELAKLTHFQLAAAHDLISMSGSLVIALAVMTKQVSATEGWKISRVDEDWQTEQWGHDDEASAQAQIKCDAFHNAAQFFEMSLT